MVLSKGNYEKKLAQPITMSCTKFERNYFSGMNNISMFNHQFVLLVKLIMYLKLEETISGENILSPFIIVNI